MAGEESLNGGGVQATSSDLEEALTRIPSVTAARVVTAGNRVAEVHILARRDRAPKQLVRDVQSVALATFGVEVDYRTVSVVQLEEPLVEGEGRETVPRIALLRLSAEVGAAAAEIKVHVESRSHEHVGSSRGPASSGLRLVARAVVDAVAELVGDAALDVEFADVLPAGQHSVAVAVLRLATQAKGDLVVSGSAVVRKDANDAMARATLAALNRLIQ